MKYMQNIEQSGNSMERRWISIVSDLEGIDGAKKNIKIEIMEDGMPRAMAFFDIDETLAHLSIIHGPAIRKLFPNVDPTELEMVYYAGFKLGNSFREFDRMKGIYEDSQTRWKDPKVYWEERYLPHVKEIDEPGNLAHNIAAGILKAYGEIAARVADEIYENDPKQFEKSNIAPIFFLARLYSRLGIPIVGFTANAGILVKALAKYLKLSETFIDIATDEIMQGGGKELAVLALMKKLESKQGVSVPKDRLIFVGDSIRGDIGVMIEVQKIDPKIRGTGVLVLKNKAALVQIKKEINEDRSLRKIADMIDVHGFVLDEVPLNPKGEPTLLSIHRNKFLEKL